MLEKCSTAQSFIRTEMTTYRIGTLDSQQNPSRILANSQQTHLERSNRGYSKKSLPMASPSGLSKWSLQMSSPNESAGSLPGFCWGSAGGQLGVCHGQSGVRRGPLGVHRGMSGIHCRYVGSLSGVCLESISSLSGVRQESVKSPSGVC
jgi:hypothetical protein